MSVTGGYADREALTPFIGRTVAAIDNGEYTLTITFTDGSTIIANGNRWDGCSLGVECEEKQ